MFDEDVLSMSPGQILLDAPVDAWVQKMGQAIAEAQLQLDQVSIRVATMLSETKVDVTNSDGSKSTKSLLELGFSPTFYQFTEADLEVRMTITLKAEKGYGINIGPGGKQEGSGNEGGGNSGNSDGEGGGKLSNVVEATRAVLTAVPWNVYYYRKYDYQVEGTSIVKTKLVTVPAPQAYIDALTNNARYANNND